MEYNQGDEPLTETITRPIDVIKDIEARRIDLGLKKYEIAKKAKLTKPMLSYLIRRGTEGHELPKKCLDKVLKALERLEKEAGI